MNLRPATVYLCCWLLLLASLVLSLRANHRFNQRVTILSDQLGVVKSERDAAISKSMRDLDEGWRLGFQDGTNLSRIHILDHYTRGWHDGAMDAFVFACEVLTNTAPMNPDRLKEMRNLRIYQYRP